MDQPVIQLQYLLANLSHSVRHVFSCDNEVEARDFIRANHNPAHIYNDVRERPIPATRLHVFGAGPPCQAFAPEGKRQGLADTKGRGALFQVSVDFIVRALPLMVFLENSHLLQNHDKGRFCRSIVHDLTRAGYRVRVIMVNADECGLPQYRRRCYIVGIHKDAGAGLVRTPTRHRLSTEDILAPPTPSDDVTARPSATGAKHAVDHAFAAYTASFPGSAPAGFVAIRHSRKYVDCGRVVIRSVVPALTHKASSQPAWVVQRGRPLTFTEAARAQGILAHRHVWPVTTTVAFRLLGNSMAGSVVYFLLVDALAIVAPDAQLDLWWQQGEQHFQADAALDGVGLPGSYPPSAKPTRAKGAAAATTRSEHTSGRPAATTGKSGTGGYDVPGGDTGHTCVPVTRDIGDHDDDNNEDHHNGHGDDHDAATTTALATAKTLATATTLATTTTLTPSSSGLRGPLACSKAPSRSPIFFSGT